HGRLDDERVALLAQLLQRGLEHVDIVVAHLRQHLDQISHAQLRPKIRARRYSGRRVEASFTINSNRTVIGAALAGSRIEMLSRSFSRSKDSVLSASTGFQPSCGREAM